jgi:hypothetical protein
MRAEDKSWTLLLLDATANKFFVHNAHSLKHRRSKTSRCGHPMSEHSLGTKLSHPSRILTNIEHFLGLLTSNIHLYKILHQCSQQEHRLRFFLFLKLTLLLIHS